MDVAAFCLVLLALTVFVARPLYQRTKPSAPAERDGLEATHAVVVRALSDLEVDHESGALDEATYAAERASLEARGTDVLKRLEGRHD